MIKIENLEMVGSMMAVDIPIGTVFTGKIQNEKELFIKASASLISSFCDPVHRYWTILASAFGSLEIIDYKPVNITITIDN